MNLKIPYVDHAGFLRNYIPDFVVKPPNIMLIVETKRRVEIDVAAKDAQMKRWTKMVSERTKEHRQFLRVNQNDFDGGGYNSIHDFLILHQSKNIEMIFPKLITDQKVHLLYI
ncbi:TPA: hypothetical protein JAN57_11150 [Legionella pneumophila]|nr:hypothetical protein [Legionella pneumophila]HAU1656908.1 hypothetical protein [Legionella pneumophila]